MAHLDRSKKIEFRIDDQKIVLEKTLYDLLRPIASLIGQQAKECNEVAINWFETAFNQIITVAREILEEKEKDNG
jgi:hypothetical protein